MTTSGRTILFGAALSLTTLLFSLRPLPAQTVVSELSGIVRRAGGAPVAGIHVELTSDRLRLPQITGVEGGFSYCCLPPGHYLIVLRIETATSPGTRPIVLAPATSHELHVTLDPNGDPEWSMEERQLPAMSRQYSQSEFESMPNAFSLATFLANTELSVTPEHFDISGMHNTDSSLSGSRGNSWSQNRLSLNGFDLTNGDGSETFFVPDFSLFRNVVYAAVPEDARAGTELSVYSHPAPSVFQGQVNVSYQNSALQDTNVTSRLRSFGITESDERFRYATRVDTHVGGRMAKDWRFVGSAGLLRNRKTIRNHALPVSSGLSTLAFKAAGEISARDTLVFEWVGQAGHKPHWGASPQVSREATNDVSHSFNVLQARWTRILSPRSSFTAGASFSAGSFTADLQSDAGPSRENLFPGSIDIPFIPSAESGIPIVAQLNNVFTGSAPLASSSREDRLEGLLQINMLKGSHRWTHRITAGMAFERLGSARNSGAFRDMTLRFFRGEADSILFNPPAENGNRASLIRLYARDSIGWGKLTLDFSGHAQWSGGRNLESAGLSGSHLSFADGDIRAGASYVIGERYPAVLRASVTRSHYTSLLRALGAVNPSGTAYRIHSWNDLNRDRDFQIQELGALRKAYGARFSRLDPGLEPPHANAVHLEISQAFPGRFSLIVHGYRRVEHNHQALINTAVPLSAYEAVEVFDPGDDGASSTGDERSITVYNQRADTLGRDAYLLTNPAGEGAFAEGYEARIIREGPRFRMELSFTRYRSVARTAVGNGPRENDWSIFPVVNDPNQAINAYGSTYFDRGLGARFWGIVQADRHTRVGWIVSYLDGAPFGRLLPVTGLNQGTLGILATLRGPGNGTVKGGKRTAYNLTADLRISREFRLESGRITASADVFNLLNRAAALREADVTSPVHLWRIPLRFQAPRSLQLGLLYRW